LSSLRYFCPDALFFVYLLMLYVFFAGGVRIAPGHDCAGYRLKSGLSVIFVTFRIIYATKAL